MKLLADHPPQIALQLAVDTILGTLGAIEINKCNHNTNFISESFCHGAELLVMFDENSIAIDYETYTTVAISHVIADFVGGFNKKLAWSITNNELIDNENTDLYAEITLNNSECGDVIICINQSLVLEEKWT